ncbi:hypothetical protein BKA93DRAFT_716391, partial [Sparassis latifolia]
GETEHRRAKQRFERTSKKDFTAQLASIERREARIRSISDRVANAAGAGTPSPHLARSEDVAAPPPHLHHAIAVSQKNIIYIGPWLRQHYGDPAIQACIITHRILQVFHPRKIGEGAPVWNDIDRDSVAIKDDRLYSHQTLTINYTTYDVRRAQDTINPSTDRCNVMVLADNDDPHAHPFWYARILGIYHVNAVDLSPHSD